MNQYFHRKLKQNGEYCLHSGMNILFSEYYLCCKIRILCVQCSIVCIFCILFVQ